MMNSTFDLINYFLRQRSLGKLYRTERLILFFCILYLYGDTRVQAQVNPDEVLFLDEESSLRLGGNPEEISDKRLIELNQIQVSDLEQFAWLSSFKKQAILAYIDQNKPLISIYELQNVKELSLEELRTLSMYIHVANKFQTEFGASDLKDQSNARLVCRWTRKLQLEDQYFSSDSVASGFIGSPDQMYLSYRNQKAGRFSYGFQLEKDAGEPWLHSNKTIDFVSAHFYLENFGRQKWTIALGDFSARLGQGLLSDNLFVVGRNQQFGSLLRRSLETRAYRSLLEDNMLRGIALKRKLSSHFQILAFVSRNKMDATLSEGAGNTIENTAQERFFTSFNLSGLHRSQNEIAKRNIAHLTLSGVGIQTNYRRYSVGINGLMQSTEFQKKSSARPDLVFDNLAKDQYYLSVDAKYQWRNLVFWAELGADARAKHGAIAGVLLGISKSTEMVLLYRDYHPGFNPLMGQSYASSSKNKNERGLLWGMNTQINSKQTVNISVDYYQSPWLRYNGQELQYTSDQSLRYTYTVRKKWNTYLQMTRRKQNSSSTDEVGTANSVVQSRYQMRWNTEIKLRYDLTWRFRIEWNEMREGEMQTRGQMISTDLLYKDFESKFSGTMRFGLFDTDSYDSRIYSFENDVLYQYSIPAYYGRGNIFYVNLRYRAAKKLTIESRFSSTFKPSAQETENQTNPYNQELKLQISYRLGR
ncbi:MAG TPA: helix-hairpin-helix domain-containing protein [Saprospiraceae bacterium]|nr:helix-hairpin-helix domain-containing protein [Saprospiraceae bacterium]